MRKGFCVLLILTMALTGILAAQADTISTHDETVYAQLDPTGMPRSVSAVVRADLQAGEYEDNGAYLSVQPLSDADVSIADGQITISMPRDGSLYYQGDLTGAELPWVVSLAFFKDGEPIDAAGIAGQAGVFDVVLKIEKNEAADPWFSQNLTLQAQININLDDMRVLSCEGASCAVTGSTMTVAYNVLPGGGLNARIRVETDGFALSEITITALRSEMQIDGVDAVMETLKQMNASPENAATDDMDMQTVKEMLTQLASAGTQLTDGYQALYDGVSQIKTDGAAEVYLKVLASQIDSDVAADKQTAQLAQSLLDLTGGMEQLQSGFGQFGEGLTQYADGVTQIAQTATALLDAIEGQESLAALLGSLSGEQAYEAKSFAGSETPLRSVQFVMRTQAVSIPVTPSEPPVSEGNGTLLSRFLSIFSQ